MPRLRRRPDHLDGRAHHLRHLNGPELQAELARNNARHIEDILNNAGLRLRVADDNPEPLLQSLRLGRAPEEDLRPAQDRVQGRPNLVRDDAQKLVLRAVRRLRLAPRLPLGLVQAGPIERLSALPRQREEQKPVVLRKAARLVEAQHHHAGRPPLEQERHARHGPRPEERPDAAIQGVRRA
jgi:hypothetical protein